MVEVRVEVAGSPLWLGSRRDLGLIGCGHGRTLNRLVGQFKNDRRLLQPRLLLYIGQCVTLEPRHRLSGRDGSCR